MKACRHTDIIWADRAKERMGIMKKIEKMTKKAVEAALAGMGIVVDLHIGLHETAPVRTPGAVGICETKKGNCMVYMVNGNGKLYNTSVHTNRREANGRVYQRIVAANA